MKKIRFIVESGQSNYSCFAELPTGLVVSTGKNLTDIKRKAKKALAGHVMVCVEDGDKVPVWLEKGKYEVSFVFDTQSFLEYYEHVFSRAALSRITGINEKQLGHYIQRRHRPRLDKAKKIEKAMHEIGKELLSVELA